MAQMLGHKESCSFIKAAEILVEQIASTQTIIVDSAFTALTCGSDSATLGSAGASVSSYHPTTPPTGLDANTWHPIGLFNDKANSDTFLPAADSYTGNATGSDINAKFNSDLGDADCLNGNYWYYGYDAPLWKRYWVCYRVTS